MKLTECGSKWAWQARHVLTQDNAGGGALRIRVNIPTGSVATLIALYAKGSASGGNTLKVYLMDEDNTRAGLLASIAAGANLETHLPSIGAVASASANLTNSCGLKILPGQFLAADSATCLQTETETMYIALLLSAPTLPTVVTTGSAGTPNLAASTISAANTLQRVRA